MNPRVAFTFVCLLCAAALVCPAAGSTETVWYGFCTKKKSDSCGKPFNVDLAETDMCGWMSKLTASGNVMLEAKDRRGQWVLSPSTAPLTRKGGRPSAKEAAKHRKAFRDCCKGGLTGTKGCFAKSTKLAKKTPKGKYVQEGYCLEKGNVCSSRPRKIHGKRTRSCGNKLKGDFPIKQINKGAKKNAWRLTSQAVKQKGLSAAKVKNYWADFEKCCYMPNFFQTHGQLAFCQETR